MISLPSPPNSAGSPPAICVRQNAATLWPAPRKRPVIVIPVLDVFAQSFVRRPHRHSQILQRMRRFLDFEQGRVKRQFIAQIGFFAPQLALAIASTLAAISV